jgi:RAD3-like DEAD/DEAH box helicase
MPANFSEGLIRLYRKLLIADMQRRLPTPESSNGETIADEDLGRLISSASILALSTDAEDRTVAYEIATRTANLRNDLPPALLKAADLLLSRLGNFPGRQLLRERYGEAFSETAIAPYLDLEVVAREIENTVEDPASDAKLLTDFQVGMLEAFSESPAVSVSAPTSAGKSFILSLEVIRKLTQQPQASVVYLVPTRALIRQVILTLRRDLVKSGLGNVPLRSVPTPIARDAAPSGVVYVLTQERLLSLLHADEADVWITTLIVDEAQGIGDGARGVLLHSAIDAVLERFPEAKVFFASPLARNPEYLLKLFRRSGLPFLEQHSPVSQNLVLVGPGNVGATFASFQLVLPGERVDLGERDLGFSLREVGVLSRRAKLALAVQGARSCCIVYANGARDAEKIAAEIASAIASAPTQDQEVAEFVTFLEEQVHKEYGLIDALKKKVGFHYSNMPGSVRAGVEELCARNKLKFICCTSTLLQGVNLPARDIVIENPKRGMGKPMQRGDFVNLAGRAGRLLREFHGNVWCLRPDLWEEPSYEGESLHEIESAFAKALADGGTAIRQVLDDDGGLDDRNRDTAIAALTRVYTEFTLSGKSLADSEYHTPKNEASLIETAERLRNLETSLPPELFGRNYGVLPMRLEALRQYFSRVDNPLELIPIAPFIPKTNSRLFEIFYTVERELQHDSTERYRYYWRLATQWIHQRPLRQIIDERIQFLRTRDAGINIRNVIYEVVEDIETVLRYRFVKHLRAYNDVLTVVLRESGFPQQAESLPPMHLYLECGAADIVAISLISLGLSRVAALFLKGRIDLPRDATPEHCLRKLRPLELDAMPLPVYCRRELLALGFGR